MDKKDIEHILQSVARGRTSINDALDQLKDLPFTNLGFARIDTHRSLRQGMAEVIFAPGKTPLQIARIAHELKSKHKLVLSTRVDQETALAIRVLSPDANYHQEERIVSWGVLPEPAQIAPHEPYVAVVTAGTGDLPVAREAAFILRANGTAVESIYDVGVAGLQRLLSCLSIIAKAKVVIAVAGMDGALPSLIGGLVGSPVIALPTSVGYGSSFQGLAALLSMLNSCAAGLTVVNIDNGFGAAVAALRIISACKNSRTEETPALDVSNSTAFVLSQP